MDLTEIGGPRLSKLVSMESKGQLIMASNGSLVSTGNAVGHMQLLTVAAARVENARTVLCL